jgi:ribosomal protein S18 acetylase RimI-like enzyme
LLDSQLSFRKARAEDVPAIVRMRADDPLGAAREKIGDPLPDTYSKAFASIEADPNNELVVAKLDTEILGVFQITYIPNLTYQGSWRALIEGVRISSKARAKGIGRAMVESAIARARERGCSLVQLTTDKSRPDAKRFYESLGFVASHEGMKLNIDAARKV